MDMGSIFPGQGMDTKAYITGTHEPLTEHGTRYTPRDLTCICNSGVRWVFQVYM